MIAYKSRYAAEIWLGGRQAAEIWLGDKLVWSGKRVPLRVLVDLGLISRAQLLAALGKAGVSKPELQLIASALALGGNGFAGGVQKETLVSRGLAEGEAGRAGAAVLRLEAAQADGGAELPGVLLGQEAVRMFPTAMPGSAAGRRAKKSAKLEEKAADAEFGAGKSAEKAARLDKPFVLPKAGPGGDAQAERRLDAEGAAGAFGNGYKAERTGRLDGLLADGRAGTERKAEISRALGVLYAAGVFGAEIRAEKNVRADTLTAGAAFGHGFAGKKTDRLEVLTASGRYGAERRAEVEKALWVLYGDGAFERGVAARKSWKIFSFAAMAKRGIGHYAQKTASIFDSFAAVKHGTGQIAQKAADIFGGWALARFGTGHRSRKQAVLEITEGALAGLAGVKSTAGAVLEKSAAKVQRSGQIFAKVQREGLVLATKAKIRPEKQIQALAKLAARARAGLLGALGRKARIPNEAGTRANALAAKSGGGLLCADMRIKPVALALPVAILSKRLQGAAKAGIFALAMPEKADAEPLRGGAKMANADAVPECVPGSRMQGQRQADRALTGLGKAAPGVLQSAARAEIADAGMSAATARAGKAKGAMLRAVCVLRAEEVPETGWANRQDGHTLYIFGAWEACRSGSVLDFSGADVRQAGSCLEISSLAQMQKRGSVLTLGSSEAVLEEADAVQNGRVLEILGVNEAVLTAVFAAVQKNNILEVE